MASGGRERILEAAYACVARTGMGKTTVEEAAREAGVSRATVYRYFPGGKDELLRDVIAWEMRRFFTRLADAVARSGDLADVCERALLFAHRAVTEHVVLQHVLQSEPERLVPRLTDEANRIQPYVAAFLAPWLEAEATAGRLRPGVEVDAAADVLGRMLLSFMNAPGRWDLDDPASVHRLVVQLLAGVAPPADA